MIQVAWILCNNSWNRIESNDFIIKPENFEIPRDASRVHGISTERAIKEGEDLIRVLNEFNELVKRADLMVAHNISFDEKVLGAELLRKKTQSDFNRKNKVLLILATFAISCQHAIW